MQPPERFVSFLFVFLTLRFSFPQARRLILEIVGPSSHSFWPATCSEIGISQLCLQDAPSESSLSYSFPVQGFLFISVMEKVCKSPWRKITQKVGHTDTALVISFSNSSVHHFSCRYCNAATSKVHFHFIPIRFVCSLFDSSNSFRYWSIEELIGLEIGETEDWRLESWRLEIGDVSVGGWIGLGSLDRNQKKKKKKKPPLELHIKTGPCDEAKTFSKVRASQVSCTSPSG